MQNRIRELRKENKMTMKQLGEIIGVAESTISQYETGKREPDNEMLLRLAEHFGVTVDFLLGASAQKETPSALTKKDERDIERKLSETLNALGGQDSLMFDGEPMDDMTQDIKRIVEQLLKKYGTRNPFEIARQRNIILLYESLGTVRGYYNTCL